MVFLVTSQGFYKNYFFDKETMSKIFLYTDKLREARVFTNAKKANEFAEKSNIKNYFLYKPKEQEYFNDLYEVKLLQNHDYNYYIPVKKISHGYNDVDYLRNKEFPTEGISLAEAKKECFSKNLKILNYISKKNEELNFIK